MARSRYYFSMWKGKGILKRKDIEGLSDRVTYYKTLHFHEGYFPEMGFSLWLFIYRLYRELRDNGAKDVFFLSKEGEFLKRLFDLYQAAAIGEQRIRSHYLLASRKSTFLCSLHPLKNEDFHRLFLHYRDISIREFLQSLNFDKDIISKLCLLLAVASDLRIQDLSNRQEFKALLALDLFKDHFESRRRQQRSNLISYLESFGVDLSKGVHLVDVGWKGSIQDNLFHLLEGRIPFNGYYIGSLNATERDGKNQKKGILFDNHSGNTPFLNVFNNNRSLFEMMLGATHGSADCYLVSSEYNKASDAHLAIYSDIDMGNSRLLVMTVDFPEERELFANVIQPLQDNMYRLFSEFTEGFVRSDRILPDIEWFARRHARMVFTPEKAEVDFFENLYHLENFGIFEYTDFKSINSLSLGRRLKNLVDVVKDGSLLESGVWPPVILRRLGLDFLRHIDGRRRFLREFVWTKDHQTCR